ncbi:hypothetical protein [uncultured Roseobacter sp.]|uniref:hypothetical protein n=1 Tax=uncultured Roseobacter sp. TaxID=114847 RepID=UPI00262D8BFA|nr:hypothetical protein [uncultured Roseobacter sp.]
MILRLTLEEHHLPIVRAGRFRKGAKPVPRIGCAEAEAILRALLGIAMDRHTKGGSLEKRGIRTFRLIYRSMST